MTQIIPSAEIDMQLVAWARPATDAESAERRERDAAAEEARSQAKAQASSARRRIEAEKARHGFMD